MWRKENMVGENPYSDLFQEKKLEIKKILDSLSPGNERMNDAKAEEYVTMDFFKTVLREIGEKGEECRAWPKPGDGEKRIYINDRALGQGQRMYLLWEEEKKYFILYNEGNVETQILNKWERINESILRDDKKSKEKLETVLKKLERRNGEFERDNQKFRKYS